MIKELIDLELLIQKLDSVLHKESEKDSIEIQVEDIVFEQIMLGYKLELSKLYRHDPPMWYGVKKELESIIEMKYKGYALIKTGAEKQREYKIEQLVTSFEGIKK